MHILLLWNKFMWNMTRHNSTLLSWVWQELVIRLSRQLHFCWGNIPGRTIDLTVVNDRWRLQLEPWSQAVMRVHYRTVIQVHRQNDWSSIQDDRAAIAGEHPTVGWCRVDATLDKRRIRRMCQELIIDESDNRIIECNKRQWQITMTGYDVKESPC